MKSGVHSQGATSTLPINPAGGRPARPRVARPRVLKTSSGLLYEALAGVYADLGFDVLGDEVFRDLVIARIAEPTRLLDADRVLADLGRVPASHSTRKRTLRRAQAGGYREQIAAACFAHARAAGDVSLVLYNVTTLYFKAEKENSLRKVGYSKERRVDPDPGSPRLRCVRATRHRDSRGECGRRRSRGSAAGFAASRRDHSDRTNTR